MRRLFPIAVAALVVLAALIGAATATAKTRGTVTGAVINKPSKVIMVRRGARIARLVVTNRARLAGATAGDTVRIETHKARSGWVVDRTTILARAVTPAATITAGPIDTVRQTTSTFAWRTKGTVVWTSCSLDGSAWVTCASPATFTGLGPGAHRFGLLVRNGRDHQVVVRDWAVASDVPPPPPPAPPKNTALPAISGTAQSRKTIRTSTGTWSNVPTGFTYQWQSCTSATGGCSDITGATSASYTCTTTDIDRYLRVAVTAVNTAGGATAVSAAAPKTLPS